MLGRKIERRMPRWVAFVQSNKISHSGRFALAEPTDSKTPTRAMADLAAICLIGAVISKDCASPLVDLHKSLPINILSTKMTSRRSLAIRCGAAWRANLAALRKSRLRRCGAAKATVR